MIIIKWWVALKKLHFLLEKWIWFQLWHSNILISSWMDIVQLSLLLTFSRNLSIAMLLQKKEFQEYILTPNVTNSRQCKNQLAEISM